MIQVKRILGSVIIKPLPTSTKNQKKNKNIIPCVHHQYIPVPPILLYNSIQILYSSASSPASNCCTRRQCRVNSRRCFRSKWRHQVRPEYKMKVMNFRNMYPTNSDKFTRTWRPIRSRHVLQCNLPNCQLWLTNNNSHSTGKLNIWNVVVSVRNSKVPTWTDCSEADEENWAAEQVDHNPISDLQVSV